MRFDKAPLGEHELILNFDPKLHQYFESFEINPYRVAEIAEVMGAVEAIDRRLTINSELPRNLVINYWGQRPKELSMSRDYLGAFTSPREAIKSSPAADIHIFPLRMVDIFFPNAQINLNGANSNDLGKVSRRVGAQVQQTTRHELSHFKNPERDLIYAAGLSRWQKRRIRKELLTKDYIAAAADPAVVELKQKLGQLLPPDRLSSRLKLRAAKLGHEILEESSRRLGLVLPECSEALGLALEIDWKQEYQLLPSEVGARKEADVYSKLGHFCYLVLRPEALPKPTTSILSTLGRLAYAADVSGTIAE